MSYTVFVVPAAVCAILIYAHAKKVDILKEFTAGALDGLKTAKNLIPPLAIMLTAIAMFRCSGALDLIVGALSKPAALVGIPAETLPLMLMKTFSGSGSVALLEDLFKTFGPDSFAGRVASVVAGATETTFYTIAVYYGAIGISKTRHTVPAALTSDIAGFILSAFFVRLFFYGI